MAGKAVPGQISTLYQYIHPAIAGSNGDLTTASRQNAMLQASVLSETSPVLADLVKQNTGDSRSDVRCGQRRSHHDRSLMAIFRPDSSAIATITVLLTNMGSLSPAAPRASANTKVVAG